MTTGTVESIALWAEGDTEYVHIVLHGGESVYLQGPRSGFTYTEIQENGVIRYECQFKGMRVSEKPKRYRNLDGL